MLLSAPRASQSAATAGRGREGDLRRPVRAPGGLRGRGTAPKPARDQRERAACEHNRRRLPSPHRSHSILDPLRLPLSLPFSPDPRSSFRPPSLPFPLDPRSRFHPSSIRSPPHPRSSFFPILDPFHLSPSLISTSPSRSFCSLDLTHSHPHHPLIPHPRSRFHPSSLQIPFLTSIHFSPVIAPIPFPTPIQLSPPPSIQSTPYLDSFHLPPPSTSHLPPRSISQPDLDPILTPRIPVF